MPPPVTCQKYNHAHSSCDVLETSLFQKFSCTGYKKELVVRSMYVLVSKLSQWGKFDARILIFSPHPHIPHFQVISGILYFPSLSTSNKIFFGGHKELFSRQSFPAALQVVLVNWRFTRKPVCIFMSSSHVMLQSLSFTKSCIAMVERVGLEAWKKWSAKGSPGIHFCRLVPVKVKETLPSNVSPQSIFHLKSCIAPVTRRGFPLAAAMQAVFVGWSCVPARKWSTAAGKKMVRQGKKTRLQSSIRTNARKCLPRRQESLENRQARQSRSGQAGNGAKN